MPMSKEDRKTAIYKFSITSCMNYTHPSLSDSASIAVWKVFAGLLAMQTALVQETRPIEFHFRMRLQEHPLVMVSENSDVIFANTMLVLLYDIATKITKNKIDNINKGMELPGRVQQILETETKPLIGQDEFDALLASRKTDIRKNEFSPLARQQAAVTQETGSSNVVTVKKSSAASALIPKNPPQSNQQNFCGRCRGRTPSVGIPMGPSVEHIGKGNKNPIQVSSISQVESVDGENENTTERHKLFAFGEEFSPNGLRLKFFTNERFDAAKGAGALSTRDRPFRPIAYVPST
ncbi:hypothetical protein AYI68_g5722 [Smittium mucronatum]|uniref:Uncharacterized protein n=1 Tax=Smittium mucronatum TaxID=133383 RepID=A0A1R0GTG5_9FUNG|nr:hypothetical protein AYI68_g5722 [Smittium mucronatum]